MRPRAAGPGGVERRRSVRRSPEELTEPVTVIGARLLEISHHGLLLEAPVPLAPDSTLRLRLLVGGTRTEVEARVAGCRRRPPGRGRPWGVGMEFTEIPADARRQLIRALGTWRSRTRSA